MEKSVPRDMRPSGFCFLVYTSDPSSNLYVLYLTVFEAIDHHYGVSVVCLFFLHGLQHLSWYSFFAVVQFFCVLYMYYYACSLQV